MMDKPTNDQLHDAWAEGVLAGTRNEQRHAAFDFRAHLANQHEWSERTFGPGHRTQGVIDHIRKELKEIEAEPLDLMEWIDVVILALDGCWRAGYSPDEIIAALIAKQKRNEARQWPDWRTQDPNAAITHIHTEAAPPPEPVYSIDDKQWEGENLIQRRLEYNYMEAMYGVHTQALIQLEALRADNLRLVNDLEAEGVRLEQLHAEVAQAEQRGYEAAKQQAVQMCQWVYDQANNEPYRAGARDCQWGIIHMSSEPQSAPTAGAAEAERGQENSMTNEPECAAGYRCRLPAAGRLCSVAATVADRD